MQKPANAIDLIVGGRLRFRRVQLGFDVASLARAVGISGVQLETMEEGRERIGARLLLQFSRVLKVAPGYFFDRPCAQGTNEKALTLEIVGDTRD